MTDQPTRPRRPLRRYDDPAHRPGTVQECLDAIALVEGDIAGIESQIARFEKAPKDAEWPVRARSALKTMNTERAWLIGRCKVLSDAQARFVEVARVKLPREVFDSLLADSI